MQINVGTEALDAINPMLTTIMGTNPPMITAANLGAAAAIDGITVKQLEDLFELALYAAFSAGEDFTHQQYEDEN
jgi:hypothetical protein